MVDGELRLTLKDHDVSGSFGNTKATITMPALTRFEMAGAGAATITHMSGDALSVEYSGAGSLKADGQVKTLKLEIAGVGSIDTRHLLAEKVKVDVGGVGNVKVYASDTLEADVGGVELAHLLRQPARRAQERGRHRQHQQGRLTRAHLSRAPI